MHAGRVVPLNEVGDIAVTAKQLLQLFAADAGQNCRIGNLVAVEVQDRQNGAVELRD